MQTNSSKGMIGEMKFAEMCYKMDYSVSKPMNDDNSYDFIVDTKNRLIKVQVKTLYLKSQEEGKEARWRLTLGKKKLERYKRECDLLVVYIQPLDMWYIVPADGLIEDSNVINLYPDTDNSSGRFEAYKNRFELIM